MAIWHMNKLMKIKTIPSLCLSGGCITRMFCDTVNYCGGFGGFGSQIIPAGDGAGLTAPSSSSAHKPHSQCIAMRVGSCLELPPGKAAEHGEKLGHPVPVPPCILQEQSGCNCQHGPLLSFHFISQSYTSCLSAVPCALAGDSAKCTAFFFFPRYSSEPSRCIAQVLHTCVSEILHTSV